MLYLDADVHARRWRTLPVLCLSLAVVMIANGSLNIALPALAQDLDASPSALQWMVDGYALVFAGLLFTAGTLGDRFGRKGALQAGLVLFLLAAVLATFATSAGQLIACRALMGVAAAFVMPSTLSILTSVFPPEERGRAIALWAGIAAGAAALGPVTTGFLLEHFWWGSVFLVNVPLIVLALVAGARLVPRSPDRGTEPLDLPGALLSIVAIATLVYAIIEAPAHGWASSQTLLAFAASAVLLGAFLLREHRAAHPMIDLALFRDVRFSVASAGIALSFFAMFGTFFLVTQYLQLVLGYRPVAAGLTMLPISLTMMVLAPQAPKLVARFGAARVVGAGLGLTSLGLVSFSTLGTSSPIGLIYVAYVPMMIGMSVSMSPLTTLIMSSVPHHRAGIGSAMNDTTRELGGALGVAVLGSLLTTGFAGSIGPALGGLDPDASASASTGLAGALDVARRLPGDAGTALVEAARSAYVEGMGTAALAAAGVVAVTALFAARLLPGLARTEEDRPESALAPVLEPVGVD
jgi:EmrB/QacA subfamily drug resistance transporter